MEEANVRIQEEAGLCRTTAPSHHNQQSNLAWITDSAKWGTIGYIPQGERVGIFQQANQSTIRGADDRAEIQWVRVKTLSQV
jgi:hypothetical protein